MHMPSQQPFRSLALRNPMWPAAFSQIPSHHHHHHHHPHHYLHSFSLPNPKPLNPAFSSHQSRNSPTPRPGPRPRTLSPPFPPPSLPPLKASVAACHSLAQSSVSSLSSLSLFTSQLSRQQVTILSLHWCVCRSFSSQQPPSLTSNVEENKCDEGVASSCIDGTASKREVAVAECKDFTRRLHVDATESNLDTTGTSADCTGGAAYATQPANQHIKDKVASTFSSIVHETDQVARSSTFSATTVVEDELHDISTHSSVPVADEQSDATRIGLSHAVFSEEASKLDTAGFPPSHNEDVSETQLSLSMASLSDDKGDTTNTADPVQDGAHKVDCSRNTHKRIGLARNSLERKRGLFNRYSHGRIPDLLTVPGIGPRNMEKLVAKGIGKVEELKQLYVDKFRGDSNEKMVEYLQSSVGILHKHHAMSITAYIKDTVEKEMKSDESSGSDNAVNQKKRLTFCIEGNISVGKTTFLQRVTNEAFELRDLVEIVPEPVAKWQDVGPEHFNVLDAFYAEPERYAYTFQNYVFITRLMQEQESRGGVKPLRLMERSVFSDRMVFVRAVHEAKWMNEMEISIYDSWFNPVVSVLPGLVPDGFIYLRASPDACLRRLQMRNRPEEQGVTLDYLRDLHEKHEQWLFPASTNSGGILSVTRPPPLVELPPPTIQDRVFYLEGDHVHSSIQKVPALILDCENNIDFAKDVEAKANYARQVAAFFEYVQRVKALEMKVETPQEMVSRSLILPRSTGLFMPDGSKLHHQALKSVDLRF